MERPHTNGHKTLYVFVVLAAIGLMLLILCFGVGCYPAFLQDHTECSGVVGGMLKSDSALPQKYRVMGEALEASALATSDKIGTSGKIINENNVVQRLEESREAAENYVPWWEELANSLPLGGTGEGGLLALLMAYLFRKPIRKGVHALTHNPKEDGDGKAAQS